MNHHIQTFPKSRVATLDIGAIGKSRHHVNALIELDVTRLRQQIRESKAKGAPLSFTACLIHLFAQTLRQHERMAAWLLNRRQVVVFRDINVSMIVEKELDGQRVPLPLVIEKAQERSPEAITRQIREAQERPLTGEEIVLQRRSDRMQRLYYQLPGFVRRCFWRALLRRPMAAYAKMGNVAVTSVGMMGRVNGWFIPLSVHPLCFGISGINPQPVVINGHMEIREILKVAILLDHDVADGADMARFISALAEAVERGLGD